MTRRRPARGPAGDAATPALLAAGRGACAGTDPCTTLLSKRYNVIYIYIYIYNQIVYRDKPVEKVVYVDKPVERVRFFSGGGRGESAPL